MKAIMISDKPRWCAKIMNGEKTIEVRKNKALETAIQKLINEYGYAEIYVYCSKDNKQRLYPVALLDKSNQVFKRAYREDKIDNRTNYLNGKVLFKFRCYKVEEITIGEDRRGSLFGSCHYGYHTESLRPNLLMEQSCLDVKELIDYLGKKTGYAIHISDLEIFDRPKELSEFCVRYPKEDIKFEGVKGKLLAMKPLTKAPQNFCYVEVGE